MPALEREDELTAVLAAVYGAVDWRAIGGKSAWDVWTGRVLVASTQPTLGALVTRLCGMLGVRSLPEAAAAPLEACRANEPALLALVADEHVPVAMRAVVAHKAAVAARKAAGTPTAGRG
jgi:hypothetical protein